MRALAMPRARRWCNLQDNHFLLELFHGPTLAFKDFAMQLIGQLFQTALARSGERVTIVGATSGDTGSAAMEAFRGLECGGCVHPVSRMAGCRRCSAAR
jgi:threonine synthase